MSETLNINFSDIFPTYSSESTFLFDLMDLEGPLTSAFLLDNGQVSIFDWIRQDETNNYWISSIVTIAELRRYLTKSITFKDLIFNSQSKNIRFHKIDHLGSPVHVRTFADVDIADISNYGDYLFSETLTNSSHDIESWLKQTDQDLIFVNANHRAEMIDVILTYDYQYDENSCSGEETYQYALAT